MDLDLAASLRHLFGFDSFRPMQEKAIRSALSGRDVLVVMPTGSGKSLCFQLPALMTDGVTIVVSPLVALMQDQVGALNRDDARRELGVASISSLLTSAEQRRVLDRLESGRIRLLYVAPERFRSQVFTETLRRAKVARFVVDEAHCISEWGHDFRPDYLALRGAIDDVGAPPVMALTATATRRVQEGIVESLGLRCPDVLVGGFDRPNLIWSVHRCASEKDRREKLARAIPKLAAWGGSGLIYTPTRKTCEEVGALAQSVLSKSGVGAEIYHAGVAGDERSASQDRWLKGETHLLVATNAFGMGVDKPDVRYVVHVGYPDSIEAYYQEAGRAGRDGRASRCIVLTCFQDRRTREWMIDNDALTTHDIERTYRLLRENAREGTAVLQRGAALDRLSATPTKLRLALAALERSSLVRFASESGDEVRCELSGEGWDPQRAASIDASLMRLRAERLRRLDEMAEYTWTRTCRRRMILNYFGDRESGEAGSSCCDNCAEPPPAASEPAAPLPSVPMPAALAPNDPYDLLQGIDALRPAVAAKRLSALLRASAERIITDRDRATPLFGLLRGWSKAKVTTLLDELVGAGLLSKGGEADYFVIRVTAKGRQTWQDRLALDRRRLGFRSEQGAGPEETTSLFEALRKWRRDRAIEDDVPPFLIFGDKVLHAIAESSPKTEADLLDVSGVGEGKIRAFGAEVLAVVRDNTKQPGV